MYGEGEWSGDNGRDLQKETFDRFLKIFIAEAQALPEPQQMAMLKLGVVVVPKMVAAHGVLFQLGLQDRLDLGLPLSAVCAAGADLLRDGAAGDETLRSAQLAYLSIGGLLDALSSDSLDPVLLVRAGIEVGRADVRFTQVVTGLWGVMADAQVNAATAGKLATARKNGGATQAAYNKMLAKAWQDEVLPYAIEIDSKYPDVTRERIAWEIKEHFKKKIPELRAITVWLQKQAEQPNGPLRYRGRKKPA